MVALCFFFTPLHAQYKEAEIGINGLTCSQCSRSVELRIRKLAFVKDVQMNLEHTEGRVFFKEGEKVEIGKIASAVKDAGFSVRYLKAVYHFGNETVSKDKCLDLSGDHYTFVRSKEQSLTGDVPMTFLGEKFQEKKEFRKWQSYLKSNCAGGYTYFVTL